MCPLKVDTIVCRGICRQHYWDWEMEIVLQVIGFESMLDARPFGYHRIRRLQLYTEGEGRKLAVAEDVYFCVYSVIWILASDCPFSRQGILKRPPRLFLNNVATRSSH